MLLLGLLVVLVGVVVTAALVHLLPFVFRQLIGTWRLRRVPLPTLKGNIFFGYAFHLVNWFRKPPNIHIGQHVLQIFNGMCHLHQKEGMARMDMGMLTPMVLIFKHSLVEELLKHHRQIKKSQDYVMSHPFLGAGLITSPPKTWKTHRPLIKAAFQPRVLASFQSTFSQSSQLLMEQLIPRVNQEINNLQDVLGHFGIDIISSTCFGFNSGDYDSNEHPVVKCTSVVTGCFMNRLVRPWWWLYFIFRRVSIQGRRAHRYLQELDSFTRQIMASAAAKLSGANETEEGHHRRSYYDLLLHHNVTCNPRDRLGDTELLEHARTAVVAGTDALIWSLVWATYLLGRHPEAQERAWQEVGGIFKGDKDRPITEQDLAGLDYLEAVLKESSRILPAAPLLGRELEQDVLIGGHMIPKFTNVLIISWALHRDPELYPDPELFDPDRFLKNKIPDCALVPFSEGPRKCIGFRFAMIAMKTVLCDMLRHFRWTSLDSLDYILPSWTHLLLHPKNPVRFRFESRGDEEPKPKT